MQNWPWQGLLRRHEEAPEARQPSAALEAQSAVGADEEVKDNDASSQEANSQSELDQNILSENEADAAAEEQPTGVPEAGAVSEEVAQRGAKSPG